MRVPFGNLDYLHDELSNEMRDAFERVYSQGKFIQGDECAAFEREFADMCESRYAVGVASGLDALAIALRALDVGPGDDVVLPANTFIATALAVSMVGANVVLADPEEETFNISVNTIEKVITKNTKAIIPVHLYGQPADIGEIAGFAKERGIRVIEDCAQAHGASYKSRSVGSFGDIGCFSFYPGKNLGALGDGGAIVTNSSDCEKRARELANYGSLQRYHHVEKGMNSRLDELQAAFLRVKLAHLGKMNASRSSVAQRYLNSINNPLIRLPRATSQRIHVWHIFAIRCEHRDDLRRHLEINGVETNVHYPITIADQQAYKDDGLQATPLARVLASSVLSLPLYYGMTDKEIDCVIDAVNSFRV